MKNKKAWLSAFVVFLLLQSVSGILAAWLRLRGWDLAILLGGLVLLGLVAAVLVFFLVRKRSGPATPATRRDDDIDLVLAVARKRLAARPGGAAKLGKLPLVLVLGPSGSTKTTAVIQSGLDPELLAGEVHRGDAVTPTGAVNLWYAEDLVVAEAGGALIEEPNRWARLVRHLRPSRWSAALTRRAQAPRMAVVCFPCDAFVQPGSSQSVPAAARTLRTRLVELSQQLGIRLPVYVLFTKADRIPYFEDYVRSFSREEAQQVLGATLPVPDSAAPGVYAEQESRRLTDAFQGIFRSLALRRLDVLPRENREEVKAGAYEFPREFRKITETATQFMVELCKPSQLSVTPFLRGFYFTGVRPVVVSDTASEAPATSPGGGQVALGATGVFSLQGMQTPRTPAPAASSGTRRVPEWVFLKRVFREVILPDQVARHITGGGTRVNFLRRAMLGSAAALFLVLAVGLTVSYSNNRALERDALAAAQGVEPLSATEREAPSAEALQRLEALREQTERVGQYERAGRPWRLAWGLYTGSAVYPHLRRLYFDRFDRQLFAQTRTQLVSSLQVLPDPPQNAVEFSAGYDALKAYLITTEHPEYSTPEFLTPELLKHWPPAPGVDEPRLQTTRAQFDFYARELRIQDPYRLDASDALVARVRRSLHGFSGPDRFYQSLLSHAAGSAKPVAFHQAFPGTESVVRNPHVVPAAFTREGWAVVESSLTNLNALFEREPWVLGEQTIGPAERARLASELRARYVNDYVAQWQAYLRAAGIVGFGGLPDAAQKLGRLSGNQSPLLQMFSLAAQHTAVDSAEVRRAFQPLHTVLDPGQTDRFVGGGNEPYIQALLGLQTSVDAAAKAEGPERQMAVGQASAAVGQVRMAVRQLAQGFSIDGPARSVGADVQRVMLATVDGIEGMGRPDVGGEVNPKGAGFCQQFAPVMTKYPFNPRSNTEATINEVAMVFQRGNGLVANFYNEALQPLLVRLGPTYAARPGVTPAPSRNFIDFYNRATRVSEALYNEQGEGPVVPFTIRPQTTAEFPEITVAIDGHTQTSTRTAQRQMTFEWIGQRASTARITARTATGQVLPVAEAPNGTWALFRLFHQAEWTELGPGRYNVVWTAQGQPVSAEVVFPRGQAVFHRDYFANFPCVGRIMP